MTALFSQILDMSLTGALVITAVLLVRLVLKKSPKIISYALWSVVLFRLLCPVAITAPVSLLEVSQPQVTVSSERTSTVSYLPPAFSYVPAQEQEIQPETAPVQAVETQVEPQTTPAPQAKPASRLSALSLVTYVWLGGVAIMVFHSLVTYSQLRRRLVGAMHFRDEIYLADHIPTPFVLGILRPRIYLPSDTPARERQYILAHERCHIRRLDHIIKVLAYAALCLHWFNPLVWVAFFQAGKDMEMSCDEAVLRRLGPDIRADYAQTLLRLGTNRRIIAGTPLAFGEGDTKGRVLNMAKWKKPKLWVILTSAVLCAVVLFLCAVNPGQGREKVRSCTINDFRVEFPYEYRMENNYKDTVLLKGSQEAGGIRIHDLPEDCIDDPEKQNEWHVKKYLEYREQGWRGNRTQPGDKSYLQLTLGSDTSGKHQNQYYFFHGATAYEVWFDTDVMPVEHQNQILESVQTPEETAIVEHLTRSFIDGINGELVADYNLDTKGGETICIRKGQEIGGFRRHKISKDYLNTPVKYNEWVMEEQYKPYIGAGWKGSSANHLEKFGYIDIQIVSPDGNTTMHHYYFFSGNRAYELWFDIDRISEEERQNILEHAKLRFSDNKPQQSVLYGASLEFPAYYLLETQNDEIRCILAGQEAGAFRTHVIPKEYRDKPGMELEWVLRDQYISYTRNQERADVTDSLEKEGYILMTVASETDGEFYHKHYYFFSGDRAYELWFDTNVMPQGDQEAILQTVSVPAAPASEEEPAPDPTAPKTIGLKLPFDVEARKAESGEITFVLVDVFASGDEKPVMGEPLGGIKTYALPEEPMSVYGAEEWLTAMGVHQMVSGEYDWMASSYEKADLEISFTDRYGTGTYHYFYTCGDRVYEVWFETSGNDNRFRMDSMTRYVILDSVTFAPDAQILRDLPIVKVQSPYSKESQKLQKCRETLEAIYNSPYLTIGVERSNYGGPIINDTSSVFYSRNGEDWLMTHSIPQDGILDGTPVWESKFSYMYVDGVCYNNMENTALENREVHWNKTDKLQETHPWVTRFQWDAQEVELISDLPTGKGECITLQVNAPYYEDDEEAYDYYQLQLYFDENGAFLRAETTAYFHDETEGEYTINETTKIYSMEQSYAHSAIDYEYQRALKQLGN